MISAFFWIISYTSSAISGAFETGFFITYVKPAHGLGEGLLRALVQVGHHNAEASSA